MQEKRSLGGELPAWAVCKQRGGNHWWGAQEMCPLCEGRAWIKGPLVPPSPRGM